jgi:hypothetical protein
MGKQTFNRIKKTLGILFIVFLVVSLTAASVSADAGSKGKATFSVAGKSSVTADPPSYSRDFGRHYGDFDKDFHRDFDRDFNRHFRHFRHFDKDDFDRHFGDFHRDFNRDFHGDFDRHFRGY